MEDIVRSVKESYVEYMSQDGSLHISITYLTGYPRSNNCYGKTWAKETQAILKINGFVRGYASVIKHKEDKDDPGFAIRNVTQKVLERVHMKCTRKEIWNLVFTHIKEEHADTRLSIV
jgi:hypothetical protein